MTGEDLCNKLVTLVSDRTKWKNQQQFEFNCDNFQLFTLSPNPTPNQPGNGIIKFNG